MFDRFDQGMSLSAIMVSPLEPEESSLLPHYTKSSSYEDSIIDGSEERKSSEDSLFDKTGSQCPLGMRQRFWYLRCIRKTATSTLATLATLESGQSSQSGPLWKVIEPLICAASKRSESGSFSFRADHQLSEHVLKWYYFHIALGSRFFTSFN
jgi:hypothetical protein